MKRILILGAGTAGTMMANKLLGAVDASEWTITVVDRDDRHIYQPGLIFVPFGAMRPEQLVRPRPSTLEDGVELIVSPIERIEPTTNTVLLESGDPLRYDVLIIATGTRIAPEATEGLTGVGWRETAFDFYSLDGATALARKLEGWEGGRMIVNVADMPIKCPVAPLEFTFLADAFFTKRNMRDKVEIVFATPLDGAFTKPRASALLGGMLRARNIQVETDFTLARVDGEATVIESYDGRTLDYDLLVTIPLHTGAEVIERSSMGDSLGFVPTDKHTLQSKAHENVFVIGDATDLPTSKAGSVAHFEGEVLYENLLRFIGGYPLRPDFDGHANCFIESGHGKAILIDFNYDTEPLPGRFPLPGLGPFKLLEESHVNHWGKLAFEWLYWNLLVRGRELPIEHRMRMAGKWG